ncbi:beta-ketoacyl synthase N-terminal-like domain-containing protein [Streptomyces niveus]|uniref:beta-ketoacyl [acyl carrier protein] synthase domain-containing protein n=1 Tax=Streptomyces niveus TaxID=193462 RepID=UPI0036823BF5
MDVREVLVRYKEGSLDRRSASDLLGSLVADEPGTAANSRPPAVDGIAVVGMAGRYPQAADLAAFWQNLREGRDASTDVPPARPGEPLMSGGERGYFLDGVEWFDPEFFGLTEDEARLMDPQERLFLETAWAALDDAGRTGARLDALTGAFGQTRAVGVFVGAGSADYALLGAEGRARGHRDVPRSGHWGMACRLSQLLGLDGPAHAVDAGWSSALVAVHLAVQALGRGECAAAVAGGVELLLHPSRARSDAGEGVGAVVLRPLRDALADGDRVYAVLRTTSAGVTGREPTPVALRETRSATVRRIGHAGAATGIAALTSVVLQLWHGVLAPARDGADARPWQTPRRAAVELLPEPGGDPGGLRVDVVVEEAVKSRPEPPGSPGAPVTTSRPTPPPHAARDEAVLLSASTPAHLAATARRLLGRLEDTGRPAVELPALARELRARRAGGPCRTAVVVRDIPGLRAGLRAFLRAGDGVDLRAGRGDPLGLSAVPETADYLAALWRAGRVEQVTGLWLSGVAVDWAALEPLSGDLPAGTALPAPVFLRRSLWLSGWGPGGPAG